MERSLSPCWKESFIALICEEIKEEESIESNKKVTKKINQISNMIEDQRRKFPGTDSTPLYVHIDKLQKILNEEK